MPAYVILRHEMPDGSDRPPHWDFMLEVGALLRTWALDEQPCDGCRCSAVPLADHRLAYLDYEGSISGHRGQVTQWDRGSYELVEQTEDGLEIQLEGRRLQGRARLARQSAVQVPQAAVDQRWSFSFTGVSAAT